MKILAIHNFHRKGSASGDDQVYKNETKLLEDHGNIVLKLFISNDDFDKASGLKKIKLAFGMVWSFKFYRMVRDIIIREKPDIVHVHTFSPLLSPSVLYAAHRRGVPVVATLHDTRFVCPCATSLRGNVICNKCNDGHYFRMCKYRCYKDSRIQSLIMAFIYKYHRLRKSFYNQIDLYICLNDIQIKLLTACGYDKNKIVKKYNFMEDVELNEVQVKDNGLPEKFVVFYGRIGEEKGIRVLMEVWDKLNDIPLIVMGTGPLDEEFKEWASSKENVYFLGYTKHGECLRIVKSCQFVVFPSIWYEGCSMVMIETQCLGKAILATDVGFSSEAITEGYDGTKVRLGDYEAFRNKVRYLWNDSDLCEKMGNNARKSYIEKYMAGSNYEQLIDIYKKGTLGK